MCTSDLQSMEVLWEQGESGSSQGTAPQHSLPYMNYTFQTNIIYSYYHVNFKDHGDKNNNIQRKMPQTFLKWNLKLKNVIFFLALNVAHLGGGDYSLRSSGLPPPRLIPSLKIPDSWTGLIITRKLSQYFDMYDVTRIYNFDSLYVHLLNTWVLDYLGYMLSSYFDKSLIPHVNQIQSKEKIFSMKMITFDDYILIFICTEVY